MNANGKKLKSIEDGVYQQLTRLSKLVEADATLKPLHASLLDSWSALYLEHRRRQIAEAEELGGEVICTIYHPSRRGGVGEIQFCNRLIKRRYSCEKGSPVFIDVIPPISDSARLAYHIRAEVAFRAEVA